jgi:hypothetical protein
MAEFGMNIGVVSIKLQHEDIVSLWKRFDRNPIYGGPCLILNRDTGLALDARADGKVGDHSTLWSAHAAPWQQWRINRVKQMDDEVEIVSESNGLWLTTMAMGYKWGDVWLHNKLSHNWSRRWRLKATEDRAAFAIENASSGFALDAAYEVLKKPQEDRNPHVWPSNGEPWQQWMIVRLPLT